MKERRAVVRRSGVERRHAERRTSWLRGRLPSIHGVWDRRKGLRRLEYRRSLFNRRAVAA